MTDCMLGGKYPQAAQALTLKHGDVACFAHQSPVRREGLYWRI
jgi:hypothetical protein